MISKLRVYGGGGGGVHHDLIYFLPSIILLMYPSPHITILGLNTTTSYSTTYFITGKLEHKDRIRHNFRRKLIIRQ